MVSTDGEEAAESRRLSVKVASDARDGVVGSHPAAAIVAACCRRRCAAMVPVVVVGNFMVISSKKDGDCKMTD